MGKNEKKTLKSLLDRLFDTEFCFYRIVATRIRVTLGEHNTNSVEGTEKTILASYAVKVKKERFQNRKPRLDDSSDSLYSSSTQLTSAAPMLTSETSL